MNRTKKPKPLFGLFRKSSSNKTEEINLGSGTLFLPTKSSLLAESKLISSDPYSPPLNIKRQKSLSNSKDSNKLIVTHCSIPRLKKFSSAHDLRKSVKSQQDSIHQTLDQPPLPTSSLLSRSKSLNHDKYSNKSIINSLVPKSSYSTDSIIPPLPTIFHDPISIQEQQYHNISNDLDLEIDTEDEDDNIPLGFLQSPTVEYNKTSSLLSDKEEDDDKDLIPIAIFNNDSTLQPNFAPHLELQSAADKYKERVKERLNINTTTDHDDDDDIPISIALLSPKWKK